MSIVNLDINIFTVEYSHCNSISILPEGKTVYKFLEIHQMKVCQKDNREEILYAIDVIQLH